MPVRGDGGTTQVVAVLPTAVLRQLDKAARDQERSRSKMIAIIIREWLKQQNPQDRENAECSTNR